MEGLFLFLLNQDVPHSLDVLFPVIWPVFRGVSTRVVVVRASSSTKPDSGVAATTSADVVVTKETDSCLGVARAATLSVKPFLVTAGLHGRLRTNQILPSVTTQ